MIAVRHRINNGLTYGLQWVVWVFLTACTGKARLVTDVTVHELHHLVNQAVIDDLHSAVEQRREWPAQTCVFARRIITFLSPWSESSLPATGSAQIIAGDSLHRV